MANKIGARKMLVYCSGIALALGVACVILLPEARVAVLRTLMPGVCMSEDRTTISNLSGMEFKIVYTNCDTLAKEEDISVYVREQQITENRFFRDGPTGTLSYFVTTQEIMTALCLPYGLPTATKS
jgi:hypothetical protein